MQKMLKMLFFITALIFLFGCKNGLFLDETSNKTAFLQISLNDDVARTVLPSFDLTKMTDFVLEGTKEGSENTNLGNFTG